MPGYPAAEVKTEGSVVETEPGVWLVTGQEKKKDVAKDAAEQEAESPSSKSTGDGSDASTAEESSERTNGEEASRTSTSSFGAANPSIASILLGEVRDGPRTEFFVVNFQAHLEPALKDMARAVGERWLAAGGHTGTDANPNEIIVESIMKTESENVVFQKVFTKGFAIELVSAIVGPPSPKTLFKFRHVGAFTGVYTDEDGRTWQGEGQMLDVSGVAHVSRNPATNELGKVDVYYNHLTIIKSITDAEHTL